MTQKEKRKEIRTSALDPGYLMLGMYILSVVGLVLLGWLGAAGAGDSDVEAEKNLITRQERIFTKQA